MRDLSPPSESALSGDLSRLGGWFEPSVYRSLSEQYRAVTQDLQTIEGEAVVFISLPEESFRLQITFYSSEDSSHLVYRSRAGFYTGTFIQKNGELIHLPENGESEDLGKTLPDELSVILSTTFFRFYQLAPQKDEELRFELSKGIRITLEEPVFLPGGYEIILEGYLQEKDPQSSKDVYLPKKITVQNPAEQFRVSWVHQRLNGTLRQETASTGAANVTVNPNFSE